MKSSNRVLNHMNRRSAARTALILLLTVFLIITQTGCGNKEVSETEFCLNTVCTITVYGMPEDEAENIVKEAFEEIDRYESLLSKTVKGSDIYNINNSGGKPVEVSDDTVAVIESGLLMGDISNGSFDITVGTLTDLWNFTGDDPKVPAQEDIDEAVRHIDYENIEIDGNSVTLNDPDAAIDLGGVAKGYIADRIGEFLTEKGVSSAIINLGGNVAALGAKTDGSLWSIGIERPYSDRTEVMGAVEAQDATLVTSGIYERKFEENGVMYHHVLDVSTGYPAETDLESVTITAKIGNSAFCDGLSTTCLMLGKEKAQELVARLQQEYPDMELEAAFIDKNDNMVQTDGMKISQTKN